MVVANSEKHKTERKVWWVSILILIWIGLDSSYDKLSLYHYILFADLRSHHVIDSGLLAFACGFGRLHHNGIEANIGGHFG